MQSFKPQLERCSKISYCFGGIMKRRTLLTAFPFVVSAPLLATEEKPGSGSCQTPIPGTTFSLASVESGPPARELGTVLFQLEAMINALVPLIGYYGRAIPGAPINDPAHPASLIRAGGSLVLLADALEGSEIAMQIDDDLLLHGALGFRDLLTPSDYLCQDVLNLLVSRNVTDFSLERVRHLITPSLYPGDFTRPGDAAMLNLLLSQDKGIAYILREAAIIPTEKAVQLREAGLALSPAPPRGRPALPTYDIYNPNQKLYSEEEKKVIYNRLINGLTFGATVGVAFCTKGVAHACPIAAGFGISAAFIRLITN